MNAIEWFQEKKRCLRDAQSWAALIGKKYSGGGGGFGEVCRVNAVFTIYHQPYDGATNYHEAPKALREAIESVLKSRARAIIDEALSVLDAEVKTAAKKAAAEAEEVLAEVSP